MSVLKLKKTFLVQGEDDTDIKYPSKLSVNFDANRFEECFYKMQ